MWPFKPKKRIPTEPTIALVERTKASESESLDSIISYRLAIRLTEAMALLDRALPKMDKKWICDWEDFMVGRKRDK
jgi:hypothetical protein